LTSEQSHDPGQDQRAPPAALAPKLAPEVHQRVRDLAGGKDLPRIAAELWRAPDPDVIEAEAARQFATDDKAKAALAGKLPKEASAGC
jgi:hypothetical protein